MKSALIVRYGAFGDHIHASHIPRLLKEREGFDFVAFEYNPKGHAIYYNNPFIDQHIHYDPYRSPVCDYPLSFIAKRHEQMLESGNFDKLVDLNYSLEYGYIAMEDQNSYYRSSAYRRNRFGKHNFYDQTTIFAGYPQHVGMVGEVYFDPEEEGIVQRIYERDYKDKFVVICNLSGTSKHKLLFQAEEIIKRFLEKHPEAVCITIGDDDCKDHLEFKGERIINRAGDFGKGRYPFPQAMLMAKHADMLISAESGIAVASTLFGTATVQLMNAAGIKQHGGDFVNDFSLQATVHCSPCHKGPYDYIGCPKFKHMGMDYPRCIQFNVETVLNRMEEAYDYARATKKTKTANVSALR